MASGRDSNNVIRRANHELGLYDLPSFYSADLSRQEIPMEAGSETAAELARGGRTGSLRSDVCREKKASISSTSVEMRHDRATASATGRNLYRNKCISFLALVAGMAAFGCSLAALAGTTNWVDTWEPIDLPPTQEWPALFGTGYGSLMSSRSGSSSGTGSSSGSSSSSVSSSSSGNNVGRDRSSGSSSQSSSKSSSSSSTSVVSSGGKVSSGASGGAMGFSNVAETGSVVGQTIQTKSLWDDRVGHQQNATLTQMRPPSSSSSSLTTSTTTTPRHQQQRPATEAPSVTRPVPASTAGGDDDDDEFDYDDDYYAHDEPVELAAAPPDDEVVTPHREDEQEQRDEEPRRSLVVVFHVGLFRACAVLKGELPSSVVLPNLPCAALEYINWRPLTAQSFRLWRNIEFTPDFLNKLRYATPCFLLGSFIGLVALIVAIGGRCTGPDRTLICSSLHILAGLSLGSGLIIFVSVLHDEFSLPSLRSRNTAGWSSVNSRLYQGSYHDGIGGSGSSSVAFYSDSRSLGSMTTSTTATGQHQSSVGGGSGLVSAALIPSFRYGWSFYAALAAFVSSELAAAVYIILHTHIFKWASRTRSAAETAASSSSTAKLLANDGGSSSCKEIGVQTSPLSSTSLLMMMDRRSVPAAVVNTSATVDVTHHQQVPYCDLLALDPVHVVHRETDRDPEVPPFPSAGGSVSSDNSSCRPSPMYINAGSSTETDCTCQIHYATYRPKMRNANHVAGIHRASTMPRKVAFAGDLANTYQQTPL